MQTALTSVAEQVGIDNAPALSPLETFAQDLAQQQRIESHIVSKRLTILDRPQQYATALRNAYLHFAQVAEKDLTVSYAGEWLLDNFYIVQQAFDEIRQDMPAKFYAELPRLGTNNAPLAGYPRIYGTAREVIKNSASHLEMDQIEEFLAAYQQVTPLTMGELWALPTMLRIGILERLITGLEDLIGPKTGPLRTEIAQRPSSAELGDETIVANCIISLRMLAIQDWQEFFETVSRVEHLLRREPIYPQMDFETRNRYRRMIEELAPDSGADQERVTLAAVELAQQAAQTAQDRTAHVGYYLLDAGREQLELRIGYRTTAGVRPGRWVFAHALLVYLGSILLLTALILSGITAYSLAQGSAWLQTLGIAVLAFVPAISAATTLINWIFSRTIQPHVLPKLDFKDGIPADYQAIVVIPSLLTDAAEVDSLVQQLELHYLRNPDPNLRFALLADFTDAPQEHMPDDEPLREQAQQQIQAMNEKYNGQFYLFLRSRQWNPRQNAWMGWERKRGKLSEFNLLLLNKTQNTSFVVQYGALDALQNIRYVITLDADTVLPPDSARILVGTLAHPLNRAEFAPLTNTVIAGYTVLQPRVEILPIAASRSGFSRIFAGDAGLDLYSLAVSDVYQDLFDEGVYVGKGIYDVAAFERSLEGHAPENALLSHDLFEGLYGRAALVTDVLLLENYPSHYLVYAHRMHRWIRGDWQLLPWLFSKDFSLLDRWKILDNLRRSLLAPAILLLLFAGWLGLPGSPLAWTLITLVLSSSAFLTSVANQAMRGSLQMSQLRTEFLRWGLWLTFLPHSALLALDAIVTTLSRLVQRRNLLQWTTAAHTIRLFGNELASGRIWRHMLLALTVVTGVGLLATFTHSTATPVIVPFLLLWLVSPQIAYWISQPILPAPQDLSMAQRQQLRVLARRTWSYFEEFVGPEDHWLPPDHMQQWPRGIVAHQTSPTNIGLGLLSTLAAYDMGYTGLLAMALRFRDTFDTLAKLERYAGHFLNWYDTQTLKPLLPSYVSTVDSGNLAGALLVLKQGIRDLRDGSVMRRQRWEGLLDLLAILDEILAQLEEGAATRSRADLDAICLEVKRHQDDPVTWVTFLSQLSGERWQTFSRSLALLIESESQSLDLRIYLERVQHHFSTMKRDMEILLPWLPLLVHPPALFAAPDLDPEIGDLWRGLLEMLQTIPRLGEVTTVYKIGRDQVTHLQDRLSSKPQTEPVRQAIVWCPELLHALESARLNVGALLVGLDDLARQCEDYLQAMDFGFLYDSHRQVFHIGYNVTAERLDNSYYDLLASEARVASLIAIATRQVPLTHWLHLARPLTQVAGADALLSWSGTMFEYLMPMLFVRNYRGTLLDQTYQAVVNEQIAYGHEKNVPWGISESGYYAFDGNLNYQYRAFGIPSLAFKRGLAADLVIAPYASLIALPVQPQMVLHNLDQMKEIQAVGAYGLYEAIDYTPSRLALGQRYAIVQEYMAHHQGMILLALANYLHGDSMIRRFHADPRVESVELLLQEQIPQQPEIQYPSPEAGAMIRPEQSSPNAAPWTVPIDTQLPQGHFLSNGRYGVLITNSGGGYSQWQETSLTRWRADTTLDDWGTWIYVQDLESGELWSATYQPTARQPVEHKVTFFPHKAQFERRDDDISIRLEITVPPEDDLEIRRISVTNHSEQPRRLALTSYAEVILAGQGDDARHPAFNKLFIESEALTQFNGLLFHRRLRSSNEHPIFMAHVLLVPGQQPEVHYETDRARFLKRSQTARYPLALSGNGPALSDTVGATLDPILALSQTLDVPPHKTVEVAFLTLAASSRAKLLRLAAAYQEWGQVERAFERARYQSELELRQLSLSSSQIEQIQKMLLALLYPFGGLRAPSSTLAANTKAQPGLWTFGISGDYPVLLVRLSDEAEIGLLREVLQAHLYWRNRGIKVTLVILNQRDTGYMQELYNLVYRVIVRVGSETWINRYDGIFILRADQLNDAERTLLESAARVYLDGKVGTLAAQLVSLTERPVFLPTFVPTLFVPQNDDSTAPVARPTDLQFDNGYGGFSADGREYVIYRDADHCPPKPWINVIANPQFGFTVSESGGGFTWYGNSSENRLTAWRNDPVTDMPGEAIYLRDEETAIVWSPTPLPAGDVGPYLVRHGMGYSLFEHHCQGLNQQLRLFAAPDAPVKIIHLRLENTWNRARRITVTYYAEWILGTTKDITQQYVIPDYDSASHTLMARNPYSTEFGQHVAFVTANKNLHGLTADRSEFLGRLGSMTQPSALGRIGLGSTIQAGNDPCAAIQLHVDLRPGEAEEVFFVLGEGEDRESALALARRYQDAEVVDTAWRAVGDFWDSTAHSVTVKTPDTAMNLLLPWLLYQTLSCRIWGRSALYQSSGAFGFRDQLQDVMGLLYTRPDLAREHILRAAHYQFEAGDVLHWWHPPSGRGVRTRFSDDLLWLPFVVSMYVSVTGDVAILREKVSFLKAEPLKPHEEDRYGLYESTVDMFTLYEHCRRTIEKGSTSGAHGLPLMGAGDWNDGMNRVGSEGRGESVWVGWFLCTVMGRFIPLCETMGDSPQAEKYRLRISDLQGALEKAGWDGKWYLRAFYDDGTPLGSAQNQECQIDSIVQSWAIISTIANPDRARQAMESAVHWLLDDQNQLLKLFTPPFDVTTHDPGYIKGYPPGIRENGGQYTHAALWMAWAFAQMGKGDRAEGLFRLFNPLHHADTPSKADHYQVEPYVVAADIYSVPPYTGHGGWTWYTGSAAWMYRLGIEAILGLQRAGNKLVVNPCIPADWPGFELTYRFGNTSYHVEVVNPQHICRGVNQILLDGQVVAEIPLVDDGKPHNIRVEMAS